LHSKKEEDKMSEAEILLKWKAEGIAKASELAKKIFCVKSKTTKETGFILVFRSDKESKELKEQEFHDVIDAQIAQMDLETESVIVPN
jgi:hypothetical protein